MPILQNDTGPVPGRHHLVATAGTVRWGWLPGPGDPAVLTVDPGDTITLDTVSHEGVMPAQGSDPVGYFGAHGIPADQVLADAAVLAAEHRPVRAGIDGPHIVLGPIAVRGARPGDVLVIEFLALEPRVPYGVITSRHGKGALPFEVPTVHGPDDPGVHSALCRIVDGGVQLLAGGARLNFPLTPMAGIVGVTPAGPRRHSVPPGSFGGNLDLRDLQVGSRIYLAVEVDEAGCYLGDPHFAQGHGEVALTAVEGSLRMTVRVDLIPRRHAGAMLQAMRNPIAETDTHWIALGLGESLDAAFKDATREAIALLGRRVEIDADDAIVYLSAAADFMITQVVNEVKGVHCLIRKADLGWTE